MILKPLEAELSVCKLKELVDCAALGEPCFLGITADEISLVCATDVVPDGVLAREDGWKAFRVEGTLDFSLIGILARISAILAAEQIGIFVVSTYNTDYVLTKAEDFERALQTLAATGYDVL
ncbi:MAG: ACT domain-containing protein [Firmicutes bacterium]|nr:ACT domain-containing protein [Bacillota bacterium]